MNRKKELLYNTIVIGVGNIFSKSLSFLMVPLFTMWLSTEEYGTYDVINSYISLVVPLVTLQIEQAIMRYCIDMPQRSKEFLYHAVVIICINSMLLSCVIICTDWSHGVAFSLNVVTYSFFLCVSEWVRGKKKLVDYSKANIINAICAFCYSVLAAVVLKANVDKLLVAYSLSYVTATLYLLKSNWKEIKNEKWKLSIETYKMLFLYALPLLPNALSWWVTNVSDRTLISLFLGKQFNGIYAVSCKIPTLIAVFFSIFNLAWQQSAISSSNDDENSKKAFYSDTITVLINFLFSGASIIIAFTPIFYFIGINKSYWSGMSLVPILLLGSIFLNLAQYCGGILLAQKATSVNGVTAVVAAVINLSVNFALIETIGLYAAAISTLFSYIVLFGLRISKLNQVLDGQSIIKKTICGSVIFSLFAFFSIKNSSLFVSAIIVVVAIIYFIYANKSMVWKTLLFLKGKI